MVSKMEKDYKGVATAIKDLKGQLKNIRDEFTVVNDRISALENEQRKISSLPLTKDDFQRLTLAQFDTSADTSDQGFVRYLVGRAQDTSYGGGFICNVAEMRRLAGGESGKASERLLSGGDIRLPEDGPFSAQQCISLFREPIKDAVRGYFEKIVDWPFPEAKPAAEYFQRLTEIEAELVGLKEQKGLISEAASAFGLSFGSAQDAFASAHGIILAANA